MTSYMTTTTHHRRTASLPRFNDGPSNERNGDAYVFKVNAQHTPRTPMTSRRTGDDYWSKKSLTTARSGEMVSGGGTIRRSSDKQFQPDSLPPPSSTSTPYSSRTSERTFSTMRTTSKAPQKSNSFSTHGNHSDSSRIVRSPFTRETGKSSVLADFDDGGLANWEESFKKFDFSPTSSGKLVATDDWKKKFLYQDDSRPADRLSSGSGGTRGDLVYSKTTTTRTRSGGSSPRNIGSQRGCVSDSEDSWNWLEEQRAKLEAKRARQHCSQEKLNLDEKLNQQRSEIEGRLLNDLRASQSTLTRRTPESTLTRRTPESTLTRRTPDSTLTRRTPESDLRYRARSMDNVGVNPDENEIVSYSKFGPTIQKKTSTWNSRFAETQRSPDYQRSEGLSSSDQLPAFGYGRRAYQTLPRDARLPGTLPRAPSNSSAGDLKRGQSFRNSERNVSTGSLNRRKSQENDDEEIILQPIGPGIQPLEVTSNPTSSMSRIRYQLNPNADLEKEKSVLMTQPSSGNASTLTRSSTSFRSNRPETTQSNGTSSGPLLTSAIIPPTNNTLRFQDDDVVMEQAISPSQERSSGFRSNGSGTGQFNQNPRTTPQTVRTVVVSPEIAPFPSNQPTFPQRFDSGVTPGFSSSQTIQRQWVSSNDRPSNAPSGGNNWQNQSSVTDGWNRGTGQSFAGSQSNPSEQKYFTIQSNQEFYNGNKPADVTLGNDQRHASFFIQQKQQTTHEQQIQQLLLQQQQQLEQQIFEQQKQLEQQQQQLLEQQQQLQKQLDQHRLLQQQLSRAEQQQQQQPPPQQQFSQKNDALFQLQPRSVATDQKQFLGRQQEQQVQQMQQEEQTYDLLQTQKQPQQPFIGIQHPIQQQQQQQQHLQQRMQHQQANQHQQQTPHLQLVQHPQQQLQHQTVPNRYLGQTPDNQFSINANGGSSKPTAQNSITVQNVQSSVSPPFQGHGSVESTSGRYSNNQSFTAAHGESQVTSPQYRSPFSVFQSGREPLSPTGAASTLTSNTTRECKFEVVNPTYTTPGGVESPDGSGKSFQTTVRTYHQKTISPTGYSSNGIQSPDFVSASAQDQRFQPSNGIQSPDFVTASAQDQRFMVKDLIQNSSAVPLSNTEYSFSQNLSNRTLPIQATPGNRSFPSPGDGTISPESYWIQRSTTERSVFEVPGRGNEFGVGGPRFREVSDHTTGKHISGTSSIDSSLTPLSIDVHRSKWTDVQGQSSPSFMADRSSDGSLSSSRDGALEPTSQTSIKFVKGTSHLWYKPQLSREEVISTLKNKAVGSFLVRDSNTYPGSYALAVKVASIPDTAMAKKLNSDLSEELVRHFLIEPTPSGVRLKGYKTESVFGNLDALIYQHSLTPLSLPCRLLLPSLANEAEENIIRPVENTPPTEQMVHCAFNVLFIMSVGTELLSGPEAIERATSSALEKASTLKTTVVNLKITPNGVTITDNNRALFFRQHFPAELIRYCGLDRRLRCWTHLNQQTGQITKNKIFGIISRRSGVSVENECHLFADMDSNLPSSSSSSSSSSGPILSFIHQIIPDRVRK